MKAKIILIVGPTAVGKSALAMDLAVRFDGEIVSADSQQVYRYMDIGTGKPSVAERASVRHHLIDVVDPDETFDVAQFRQSALESIADIRRRGRRAIVCGGTGLYVRALTQGLFAGPGRDPDYRAKLEKEIESKGVGSVYNRLATVDPQAAGAIHRHDRQRIMRALEVYHLTGKPISLWQSEHRFQDQPFEVLTIALRRERKELYDRIGARCEEMIQAGLLDEVRTIVDRGFTLQLNALRSVGYRQMGEVLRGMTELAVALEDMKRETRHLAKRQLTWFRRDLAVQLFHPHQDKEKVIQAIEEFLGLKNPAHS